jgi:dephospho-CoA kinase
MPLIYITGPTGAGKTTIRNRLLELGYDAYDTDEGLNGHWNIETGEYDPYPNLKDVSAKWFEQHRYNIKADLFIKLCEKSAKKLIFLCGAAFNDLEYKNSFAEIICLFTDLTVAQNRIIARSTNNFGRTDVEMESIIKRHHSVIEKYRKAGALMVNTSNKTVDDVIDQILTTARS